MGTSFFHEPLAPQLGVDSPRTPKDDGRARARSGARARGKSPEVRSRLSGPARFLLQTFWMAALVVLTGCLSRAPLKKESFSFSVPSPTNASASVSDRNLGIRSVEVASAYQGRLFVYRTGESGYERDPYAEFFVSPSESLLHAFRNYLRDSGLFQSVTEPGSFLKPDLLAELHVSQLYGDFRDLKQPAAVLRMRLAIFDPQAQGPGRPIFQKGYTRRIPFKTRTAGALMDSWNEGLKQILADVVTDLKAQNFGEKAGS
jgi:hypothetical protein